MQKKMEFPGRFHEVVTFTAPMSATDRNAGRHEVRVTTTLHQVFDFYIPVTLAKLGATDMFKERVTQVVPGATIYHGGEGLWQGLKEPIQIFRVSVELVDAVALEVWSADKVRKMMRDMCTALLGDLVRQHGHLEQAIFFNDWTTLGSLIERTGKPTRI